MNEIPRMTSCNTCKGSGLEDSLHGPISCGACRGDCLVLRRDALGRFSTIEADPAPDVGPDPVVIPRPAVCNNWERWTDNERRRTPRRTKGGRSVNEVRYVAGYGATKHILDPDRPHTDLDNDGYGLCGAYGGYPEAETGRPVCKRCAKRAVRLGGQA